MSYHNVLLVGNVGRDAELRYIPNGKAVSSFSVAVSDNGKTMWVKVTMWEKTAENLSQYIKKGTQVLVEGKLKFDDAGNPPTFESNGKTKSSFEVTANVIRLLGKKQDTAVAPTTEIEPDF